MLQIKDEKLDVSIDITWTHVCFSNIKEQLQNLLNSYHKPSHGRCSELVEELVKRYNITNKGFRKKRNGVTICRVIIQTRVSEDRFDLKTLYARSECSNKDTFNKVDGRYESLKKLLEKHKDCFTPDQITNIVHKFKTTIKQPLKAILEEEETKKQIEESSPKQVPFEQIH